MLATAPHGLLVKLLHRNEVVFCIIICSSLPLSLVITRSYVKGTVLFYLCFICFLMFSFLYVCMYVCVCVCVYACVFT